MLRKLPGRAVSNSQAAAHAGVPVLLLQISPKKEVANRQIRISRRPGAIAAFSHNLAWKLSAKYRIVALLVWQEAPFCCCHHITRGPIIHIFHVYYPQSRFRSTKCGPRTAPALVKPAQTSTCSHLSPSYFFGIIYPCILNTNLHSLIFRQLRNIQLCIKGGYSNSLARKRSHA